jgi:hypothetical protein
VTFCYILNFTTLALACNQGWGMRREISWKIDQMVLGFEHAFTSVGIQECKSHPNNFSFWESGIMLKWFKLLEQGLGDQILSKITIGKVLKSR